MLNQNARTIHIGGVPIEDLGRTPFPEIHERMQQLLAATRADGSVGRVLLVEHESVYTSGRGTPPEQRVDTVEVERGGKVTWHGPGQLVIYPIVSLPHRDVRRWLRALESFGVRICAGFDLDAEPSVDGTGVFVGGRKVASIGVAIRHWISMHGISINVAIEGQPWDRIRPCGLAPEVMSDLSRVAGRAITLQEVRRQALAELPELLAEGR